jgi:HEPN domain-containing protein
MENEENSVLKGWIKTAQEQFRVYKIIQKTEPSYTVLFRQKYNALCQSIELALKAFLISKGHSIKEVKDIGHDLIKLLDTAYSQHELMISPEVYEMIKIINPAYKSRKLLYFETEYILPIDIRSIEDIAHLLISKITFDNQNNSQSLKK